MSSDMFIEDVSRYVLISSLSELSEQKRKKKV